MTDVDKAIRTKISGLGLKWEQMAAVAVLHRAAGAVRQHLENSVLRRHDLTWTAFIVAWNLWVFGESETRRVADEIGVSKGTLTGVMHTLERRGLITRAPHPRDGRLVLVALTAEGERLMDELCPEFNEEEVFVASRLSREQCLSLADELRAIVRQLEDHGEKRRQELLGETPPPPRSSGRRRRT